MLWLLWVFIGLIVLVILIRVGLIQYAKTIPNFGDESPHIIEDLSLSEYHKSEQWQNYKKKCATISEESKEKELRMYKKNTNTYRTKEISSRNRLNFNVFNNVIGLKICKDSRSTRDEQKLNDSLQEQLLSNSGGSGSGVDAGDGGDNKDNGDYYWADVEASTTYDTFVYQCLELGFIPTVIPELKSITVGGAIVGGGIESSCFRYGLSHESMIECDVLLADGSVVTCNGNLNNKYKDLFYGMANSLGSLGYLLRCRMRIIKSKKYVAMTNIFCNNHEKLAETIVNQCEKNNIISKNYDFIDGIAYPEGHGRVMIGIMTDNPDTTDNGLLSSDEIYHRYVNGHRDNNKHLTFTMKMNDYLWRWDSDLFWCIQYIVPLQWKWLRWYLSPYIMRSDSLRHFHQKIFGRDIIVQTKHETDKGNQMFIQDIMVPSYNVSNWLKFHFNQVCALNTKSNDPLAVKHPLWLCPVKGNKNGYPLISVQEDSINVNFGFWSTVEWNKNIDLDPFVEEGIRKNKAVKMIYSTVTYTKDEFYDIYGGKEYEKLKTKYDKNNRIRHMYEKCTQK